MKIAARIILVAALGIALAMLYRRIEREDAATTVKAPSETERLVERIRRLPEAPAGWKLVETAPDEMNLDDIPDIQDELQVLADGATKHIVFESYFIRKNWGKSAKRILDSAGQGVLVLGVLHPNPMSDAPFVRELKQAGAQVIERDLAPLGGNPEEGYIHAKFLVVDGERGYIGSANFSAAGMRENREMGIIFEDESIAASLEMLAGYDAGQISSCRARDIRPAVLAQGAPDGFAMEGLPLAEAAVAALCDLARKEIDIMMFTFSHQFGNYSTIASPIRAAVRRGVKVRLIHEARTMRELQGVYPTLKDMKQWGVEVRVADISALGKSEDGQYHVKAMRIDDDLLCVGSNNWTQAASHENREISLVVRSHRMTDQFKERFNADWNTTGYIEPFVGGN